MISVTSPADLNNILGEIVKINVANWMIIKSGTQYT